MGYKRYQIDVKKADNREPHPRRFNVKVGKFALLKLLLKELWHYRGNLEVVKSRPCVYGVFSGPIGGFSPREELCVGCLRCTVQYPEMVEVSHHPEYREAVATLLFEAETGRVPIRGAGYRGPFGGEGWDGIWTDMSEIVRPTRDGIHGREFISTEINIGEKPPFLKADTVLNTVTVPIPILFDVTSKELVPVFSEAAKQLQTFAVIPVEWLRFAPPYIVPLVTDTLPENEPLMIELTDPKMLPAVQARFPKAIPILRIDYGSDLMAHYDAGFRVFHLTGNCQPEVVRNAHLAFENRNGVTLLGGGILAAEQLPKAILCGLDGAILDSVAMIALESEKVPLEWGVQRLKNLANSWRDQLLEIMGAMGLREVRRLRGEMGRALIQKELEKEAFCDIEGYH